MPASPTVGAVATSLPEMTCEQSRSTRLTVRSGCLTGSDRGRATRTVPPTSSCRGDRGRMCTMSTTERRRTPGTRTLAHVNAASAAAPPRRSSHGNAPPPRTWSRSSAASRRGHSRRSRAPRSCCSAVRSASGCAAARGLAACSCSSPSTRAAAGARPRHAATACASRATTPATALHGLALRRDEPYRRPAGLLLEGLLAGRQ